MVNESPIVNRAALHEGSPHARDATSSSVRASALVIDDGAVVPIAIGIGIAPTGHVAAGVTYVVQKQTPSCTISGGGYSTS
jgi:hypothetical protein